MHVACGYRGVTDLWAGEEEVVAGLFALYYAMDHFLLLLAQIPNFGVNPFLEVIDTPADFGMLSEFQGGVISFVECDFHLGEILNWVWVSGCMVHYLV